MPRSQDMSICLVGYELQRAQPDFSDDSDFWLRAKAEDASPFLTAFKSSPDVFHDFMVEQRVVKEIRTSTLNARIVKIEEGPAETRVLILPDVPFPI